jgi:hypothetical protein
VTVFVPPVDRETKGGIRVAAGGLEVEGVTIEVKLMIPENPLKLVRVIV